MHQASAATSTTNDDKRATVVLTLKLDQSPGQVRGIKILAWFDNGYRNVFNKVRPVVTPEDMKGLKIRVMESPLSW